MTLTGDGDDTLAAAPWFLSLHALVRMQEMGVERNEVVAVLNAPEIDYPSRQAACRTAVGERIAVAYEPASRRVVTVLYRGREYARPPLPPVPVLQATLTTTGSFAVE